jgi:hypothetical protein
MRPMFPSGVHRTAMDMARIVAGLVLKLSPGLSPAVRRGAGAGTDGRDKPGHDGRRTSIKQ